MNAMHAASFPGGFVVSNRISSWRSSVDAQHSSASAVSRRSISSAVL